MKTRNGISFACLAIVLFVFCSLSVSATLTPVTYSATSSSGASLTDSITVKVPGAAPKADVMFIFDVTGSMASVLSSAKASATNIMNSFNSTDIAFGVISHGDYDGYYDYAGYAANYGSAGDYPYALNHNITTNKTAVQNAINGLTLGMGGDEPESYSRALYESYANSSVGWREGAKRVIVEFGDNIPHNISLNTGVDPGRDAIAGTSDDLAINTVISGLAVNNIELLFVSYGYYTAQWNTWANVTGGQAYSATSDFVTLVSSAIAHGLTVSTVTNLHLQASAGFTNWLTATSPANYSGVTGVTIPFSANITVPKGTAPGTYSFKLSAIDSHGVIFGDQIVNITVPSARSYWAPTFTNSPSTTGKVGSLYSYTPTLNESATLSMVSKPSWATWSGSAMSGTPTTAGTYSFSIKATSTAGTLSSWKNWTVTVPVLAKSHWAPTFTNSPSTTGKVGSLYSYTPTLNESATLSMVSKPSWATWSGSAMSGTPTTAGTYSFSIKATSTAGTLSSWKNWTVTVPSCLVKATIDIRPCVFPNIVDLKDKGIIPVAILGTGSFDIKKINLMSITFGRTGTEAKVVGISLGDVNHDGKLDLIYYFYTSQTGFKFGDTQGILKGKMLDGSTFTGIDSVRIISTYGRC